jgi:cysteinyl-tRNA synthetase
VTAGSDAGTAEGVSEHPPADDPDAAETWARAWAIRRKEAKSARNFGEADRIRELLRGAGWEVRDNKDGSIEVVRARRAG